MVRHLKISFHGEHGLVRAVYGVSFCVARREIVGKRAARDRAVQLLAAAGIHA